MTGGRLLSVVTVAVMSVLMAVLMPVLMPVLTPAPMPPDGVLPIPGSAGAALAATSSCSRTPASVRAGQVVVVRAAGTRATVTGCTRTAHGTYRRTLGPFAARVGYNGVAPPGAKREGDGRTPGGVMPLRTGFGTAADPGVKIGWARADSRAVWVDDSASRLYNTRQRTPARSRWRSAERLDIPAYRYAQVIGHNERRRPGRGSAIFLHVSTGRATAGCVSLGRRDLLSLLRWQRRNAVIAIS